MRLETLICEKKGHITFLTMNRPERLNARNSVMMRELPLVWEDFKNDNNAWVMIVTGAGDRAFSVGVDLKEIAESHAKGEEAPSIPVTSHAYPLLEARQHGVRKPIIVAVNGMCCGGGLHFLADGDIVICSENATFWNPLPSVGQAGGPFLIGLSRRVPLWVLMRMTLMGTYERIDARRALELGLVSEVVPLPRLIPRATEIAEVICSNAPLAVWGSKEMLLKGLELPFEAAMDMAFGIINRNFHTEDYREGARAFAEKRKPQYKAR